LLFKFPLTKLATLCPPPEKQSVKQHGAGDAQVES